MEEEEEEEGEAEKMSRFAGIPADRGSSPRLLRLRRNRFEFLNNNFTEM